MSDSFDKLKSQKDAIVAKERIKSDLFDYLAWLEDHGCMRDAPKGSHYLVMASDGTTCWGKTFLEAARVAMEHDKAFQDGKEVKNEHATNANS